MGSISLNKLSITANVPLFSDLTLSIADGDRVGLVAGNGMGKTTLLRVIAGLAEPTAGEMTRSRGLRIGYVEQDIVPALLPLTLRGAVLEALPAADRETEGWRADVALDGFETPYELRDRLVSALSGGWQRLMLIARVWVTDPDALLLDEPTNHLDLGKLFRLERWINREARNIPMLVASHDRDFLDAVTNRTLFLRPGLSRYYALPFSAARRALDESDAAEEVQFERDLKEAGKLRKQAAKLTNIGINSGSDLLTVKAKYLKERAGRIEDAARPAHRERSGEIRLANRGTHARLLVGIEAVTVTTPTGQALFKIDKLHIFQGDRIVLLGRNGTGKTQLIKLLRRAIEDGGVDGIKVTPSLVLGYTDQDMSQLPATGSPEAFISTTFKLPDARVKSLLATAGFAIEKQDRPIAHLSLGQRARLGLLALRLTEPNFYLMDEPTNHVDIPGRETLESEILDHDATGLMVSHDRSFVRNVGNRYLQIEGRRVKEVEGPEGFFAEMAEGIPADHQYLLARKPLIHCGRCSIGRLAGSAGGLSLDGDGAVTTGQARGETRFIGDLMGSYVLASRALQPEGLTRLACRARSISVREATITAPVVGAVGEALTVAFQPLGILRGEILRRLDTGFIMSFDVDPADRETLEARIQWLKRKSLRAVQERREHKRVLPRETRSRLVIGVGQVVDCFIMDMSCSGAAVSADVKPPVGTLVGVGAVPGRVVRHFDCGFGVQFAELQELEHLEGLLTLKTGEHKQLAAEKLGFTQAAAE